MDKDITPQHTPSMTEELFDFALHMVAVWRVELCLLALPVGLCAWLYVRLGPIIALVITTLVMLVAALFAPLRRVLGRTLHRAQVRRQLNVAFSFQPGILSERRPAIQAVQRTPFGDRVVLSLQRGTSSDDLVCAESVLAASLGVSEVRAVADHYHKNLVRLSIVRHDPFTSAMVMSPLLRSGRTDAWGPIPVGIDEEGELVSLVLPERNLLIGGEPGAGKSVVLSNLVAGFALDPGVDLFLFDGKLVELAPWSSCARRFVGPDIELAISVLEELRTEMEHRYGILLAHGVRKVAPTDGLRLYVVVIDELALYVAGVDKKLASRFAELLRDLVARGRAAGIIVVAATQKPSIDTVPSALRDLFGFRWALRCATREASDTVLGTGWASKGFSAADIDPANRGVGLLLHEGGVPVRLKSFHLSDTDVRALSERASLFRRDDLWPKDDTGFEDDNVLKDDTETDDDTGLVDRS